MIADIFWAPAFNRAFEYTSALSAPPCLPMGPAGMRFTGDLPV